MTFWRVAKQVGPCFQLLVASGINPYEKAYRIRFLNCTILYRILRRGEAQVAHWRRGVTNTEPFVDTILGISPLVFAIAKVDDKSIRIGIALMRSTQR